MANYKVVSLGDTIVLIMSKPAGDLVASALEIVNPDDATALDLARDMGVAVRNEVDRNPFAT